MTEGQPPPESRPQTLNPLSPEGIKQITDQGKNFGKEAADLGRKQDAMAADWSSPTGSLARANNEMWQMEKDAGKIAQQIAQKEREAGISDTPTVAQDLEAGEAVLTEVLNQAKK